NDRGAIPAPATWSRTRTEWRRAARTRGRRNRPTNNILTNPENSEIISVVRKLSLFPRETHLALLRPTVPQQAWEQREPKCRSTHWKQTTRRNPPIFALQ